MEAIRAGRWALASPLPSYRDLEAFAWLGTDPVAGVRAALADPAGVERALREGQRAVERGHAPGVVADAWEAVLGQVLERPPRPVRAWPAAAVAPRESNRTLRLNLGSGDKRLPGYVNVDLTRRGGVGPDVVHDITRPLPFAAGTADEILAVHVVEHLWRWEVADVLRRWVEVLRPGGRLVLECPDLLEACRRIVDDPATTTGPGPEGQRTMWVLYGDPRWRDPLMVHRWGYTPDSLAALLTEVGLVDVRREPARFKLREPRDMRIVGRKPEA